MGKAVDISVIVLNYNTKDLLEKCLNSIKKVKIDDLILQTIVVDNGSTDSSVKLTKERFQEFQLIESKKNLGFAGGNNLGLKQAKGKYILFLNSDTEIFPQAFVEMKRFMDKDPKIGASTPKTMLFRGGMDPDCHRGFPTPWASLTYFLGLEKLFPKSKVFGQYHKFYLDLKKPHEMDAGFGTFMFVRKRALGDVGGWDESYFFYGEDLDLFYRIKQNGWKVMFYPKPLLLHHKGASSGLRSESWDVTKADRATRISAAKASIEAMDIFYKKFYRDKYHPLITLVVLLGIRVKGFFRILYHFLH